MRPMLSFFKLAAQQLHEHMDEVVLADMLNDTLKNVPAAKGTCDYKPSGAAPQAHTIGPDVFTRDYHRAVIKWNTTILMRYEEYTGSLTKDPVSGLATDLALITYVDDAAKQHMGEVANIAQKAKLVNDMLERDL